MDPFETRAVLQFLGFNGVQEFAKHCGMNRETASAILGLSAATYHKRHYVVIAIHEALHTAYVERRAKLNRMARGCVTDWAKRWKFEAMSEHLFVESAGKIREDATPVMVKDRMRKRKKVRESVLAAFNALEWGK